MATVIHQTSQGPTSVAASTTLYINLAANARLSGTVTAETNLQTTYRSAGTLSNLYINILTNDRAASTLRTRVNVGNGNMNVSITGSTTGKFEDTVNTDSVTAADEWNYSLATGAGGTVFTFSTVMTLFAATTNTVSRIGASLETSYTTASTTFIGPLAGDLQLVASAADSLNGVTYRTAGSLANLFINIKNNARTTTSTLRSRVNSANGNLVISILSGVTGFLEDTVNSDTLSSGNLINYSLTTGTGTESMSVAGVSADFTTTNNQAMYTAASGAGQVVNAGVTTYAHLSGSLRFNTTESNMILETNLAFTASLLQCNISANTIVLDSTLTLRKNSGPGNQVVTITALTTGIFQDIVNTDSIVATDTLDYEVVTPSTLTSITIRSISLLGDSTVASAISLNRIERKMPRGVLRGVSRGTI